MPLTQIVKFLLRKLYQSTLSRAALWEKTLVTNSVKSVWVIAFFSSTAPSPVAPDCSDLMLTWLLCPVSSSVNGASGWGLLQPHPPFGKSYFWWEGSPVASQSCLHRLPPLLNNEHIQTQLVFSVIKKRSRLSLPVTLIFKPLFLVPLPPSPNLLFVQFQALGYVGPRVSECIVPSPSSYRWS